MAEFTIQFPTIDNLEAGQWSPTGTGLGHHNEVGFAQRCLRLAACKQQGSRSRTVSDPANVSNENSTQGLCYLDMFIDTLGIKLRIWRSLRALVV
eukprot:4027968-Pyramimonas_sp.AAC.1